VNSAVLTLSDGTSMKVGAGFYLTKEEAYNVAQGIENMKTDLTKLSMERDAYKEAYDKAKENGDSLESIYKDLYIKYQTRVDETNKLIKDYEEKVKLTKIQGEREKKNTRVFRTLSLVELLVIGTLLL